MKRMKFYVWLMLISVLMCGCGKNCTGNDEGKPENKIKEKTEIVNPRSMPLNISIYLDLSNRIVREGMVPSQKERDIAIVNEIVEVFKDKCIKDKILQTKNCVRVVFYPAPSNPKIMTQASELEIDMSQLKGAEKRKKLSEVDSVFNVNLNDIYEETITDKKWVGCDVWDFLGSKKVDKYCMKDGYRNIVVILTDGYLYHINNKQKIGDAYSYILPETLQNPKSTLICKRDDLQNLEVMVMEINPYAPKDRDRMEDVLKNWFTNMGVKKIEIAETDLPNNTKKIIDKFVKED